MCGITGYIGERQAVEITLNNLKRLEYRGYDSSGVAYPNCSKINIVRAIGKIVNLEKSLLEENTESNIAIAHTRWATHGSPSEKNAHPHHDCTQRIAVVHNGIIENYSELRKSLIEQGHKFTSETDTETLAHLIEQTLLDFDLTQDRLSSEDFGKAVRSSLLRVRGAYAIAVIAQQVPETVFVARTDPPLVIGLGDGENFLASDISAVIRYTRRVILLEDGDFATITKEQVVITDLFGTQMNREPILVTWDDAAAEKNGFDHFMLKEIHENPRTVRDTMRGRLTDTGEIELPGVAFSPEEWKSFKRFAIVGCGTAFHAGVVGKRLFEQVLRRPVEATVASEFRYSDPIVDHETLVILVSQSGETADTLAAMREAKSKGAKTLAIVNVVGSTLSRDADAVLLTQAGPEIGVASTKAYLAQLTALTLLCLYVQQIGTGGADPNFVRALRELPSLIETCLTREKEIAELSERLAKHNCFFFLGRGYDAAASLEAALKLKEISYIHAEAYPAGEMKHGPLALVEPGVAIIGFCTQPSTNEKMVSNLKEVKAREATVISVIRDGDSIPDCSDEVISVPASLEALMPIVAMVPMQLLSYYVAKARGCDIDQPRNLAKSVTVE